MRKLILSSGALLFIAAVRTALSGGPFSNNTLFLAGISLSVGLYGWFFNKLKKLGLLQNHENGEQQSFFVQASETAW